MTRLAGRVCVVTGSSGMAADAARRFAAEGAEVVVVALDEAQARELGAAYVLADLTDERATEDAFAQIAKQHDRIDAVYAVAGGSGRAHGDTHTHAMSLDAWRATVELNATPAFLTAREAVRRMVEQPLDAAGSRGSIVLMTSVLAFDPVPALFGTHAYAAAKASTIGLMRTMAATYAPHRIRVNAIAPALVTTPMSERAAADPVTVEFARRRQPLTDGFVDPADVSAAATFLCSAESRAVTGQVLVVDGGWTVHPESPTPSTGEPPP